MMSEKLPNYISDYDPINDPFAHFCDRCSDLNEGTEFCDSLSLTSLPSWWNETATTGSDEVEL
jgi:hypothetical protein